MLMYSLTGLMAERSIYFICTCSALMTWNFPPKWKHMQEPNHWAALLSLHIMHLAIYWPVVLCRWHFLSHNNKEGVRRARRTEPGKMKWCLEEDNERQRQILFLSSGGKEDAMCPKAAVCRGVQQIKDIKHLLCLCSDFMTRGGSH